MLKTLKSLAAIALAALVAIAPLPAAAADPVASGTFTGASDHITTGGVEIIKNDDGSHTIVLAADFSLDGAPDPRVGLGKNGFYDGNTDAGVLGNLTGAQSFVVPAGVDVSAFNEVYIWCEKFSVPLGVAKLN
ncbi:DM13 domain-containing protein [uncultured Tateyamaria sp.]|uniref:DM13 domain-containing protein n=1 Tax=uncultured Tateyamaria sp. TaxID=455651 RepID=UPI00262A60C5|nr:DM13 domain-containing protein [uncultured Tateyamaria sp.]